MNAPASLGSEKIKMGYDALSMAMGAMSQIKIRITMVEDEADDDCVDDTKDVASSELLRKAKHGNPKL
jgi:hypothetical protein